MNIKSQTNKEFCCFCGCSAKDLIIKEEAALYYSLDQKNAICSNCIDIFSFDLESDGEIDDINSFFDLKPKEIVEKLNEYIIGQDSAKKTLALAAYQHYKRINSNESTEIELDKSNILLIGPTGSGKTLMVKTLAKILNVPCYIGKATALTESGYMGDDVESLIEGLLEKAKMNVSAAERGIIFIDEVDKLARSPDSGQVKDPSGLGTQHALLTLLEDDEVVAYKKYQFKEGIKVSTKNILFIASGAFSGISEVVNKRINKTNTNIGFDAVFSKVKEDQELNMSEVTSEDFVSYGLVPEFVGRFPIVSAIKGLNLEETIRVIKEPKNSILKQYKEMFSTENTELLIDDNTLEEMSKTVLKNKTGARGLRGCFNYFLEDALYDAANTEGDKICTLTKEDIIKLNKAKINLI